MDGDTLRRWAALWRRAARYHRHLARHAARETATIQTLAVRALDARARLSAAWGRAAREYRAAARMAHAAQRTERQRRRAAEARVRELERIVGLAQAWREANHGPGPDADVADAEYALIAALREEANDA